MEKPASGRQKPDWVVWGKAAREIDIYIVGYCI